MMAEYAEVIKQFKRMCKAGNCSTATGCPMYPSCNIGQCRRIAFERPAEFEQRVMAWAAEHPVQKYPSWGEYLCNIGLIHDCTESEDVVSRLFDNVIPDCIAQKLGIEPKEG